ncbi:acetyltransferase [Paenibacillus sp. HWE-109]|uniref:acetyltransferase n=1 Tax=Paenibacillus sp. HWE-109 TaxID=1306526 RepID=UPI001EE0674E|nr:acetyltransferase [Paenibacillus sp. HWE-109]UKS24986.1 acetyltransferase [Paenibacillus sp. HWE-109]
MEREKVVIIGGGGHAKVIIDIIQSTGTYEVIGFTSPIDVEKSLCCVPYLGNDSILPSLLKKKIKSFFVAIGENKLRKKLFEELVALGFAPINAISPFAHISSYAALGKGVVVMPGAVVSTGAVIGDNVIINTLAGIDHECDISSHVHVAPGASLAGCIKIGEGTFIGVGTKIIPEIKIGEWAVIGAGSVVISDIPANAKVVGVPAKKYI